MFDYTMEFILDRHGHLLDFNPARFQHRLAAWAQAVVDNGVDPALNIALFIDGTFREVCRPSPNLNKLPPNVTLWTLQKLLFSGHKWRHGLNYQGINAPNGLIVGCFGPVVGKTNDCRLLAVAMFPLLVVAGIPYRIFGDGIYPLLSHLFRPFINPVPGSIQARFNTRMATVRISGEWSFGYVSNTFQTVDFARWQRVFLNRPGLQYKLATLLMNCVSCLRGTNVTQSYFNTALPSIHDYLNGIF